MLYDPAGDVADSWGDPTLTAEGAAAVLPHGIHGCFADYMDNIWIAGNSDGVVQKWSHDGSRMLLQIGTKGLCDGPPTLNPRSPHPTCGEPGNNTSRTLLNAPADIAVDPNVDPVTGGTRLGLHRGRLRQPSDRRLRWRRKLSAAVGLGGERRGTVRRKRRGAPTLRRAWQRRAGVCMRPRPKPRSGLR